MKIIEKIKFRFWALSKRFKLIRYFFDLMAINVLMEIKLTQVKM